MKQCADGATTVATIPGIAADLVACWRDDPAAFEVLVRRLANSDHLDESMLDAVATAAGEDASALQDDILLAATDRIDQATDAYANVGWLRSTLFALTICGRRSQIENFLASGGTAVIEEAFAVSHAAGRLAAVRLAPFTINAGSAYGADLGVLHAILRAGREILLGRSTPQLAEAWDRHVLMLDTGAAMAALTDDLAEEDEDLDPEEWESGFADRPEEANATDGGLDLSPGEDDDEDPLSFRILVGQRLALFPPAGAEGGQDASSERNPLLLADPMLGDEPEDSGICLRSIDDWDRVVLPIQQEDGPSISYPVAWADLPRSLAVDYAIHRIEAILAPFEIADGKNLETTLHVATDSDEGTVTITVAESDQPLGFFTLDEWMIPDQEDFLASICRLYTEADQPMPRPLARD